MLFQHGSVAHLGERLICIQEVEGSIPFRSTKSIITPPFGGFVIKANKGGNLMLQYRYDTQLLIEGQGLDEDEITDWILENMKGDSLICVGDDEMIKIHFHTNEPWDLLSHCATLGEIFDIVVEDMDRQSRGLKG